MAEADQSLYGCRQSTRRKETFRHEGTSRFSRTVPISDYRCEIEGGKSV
jgi:hypothetical protein